MSLFCRLGQSAGGAVNKGGEEDVGLVVIKRRGTASQFISSFSLYSSLSNLKICSGTKKSMCSSTASERTGGAADGIRDGLHSLSEPLLTARAGEAASVCMSGRSSRREGALMDAHKQIARKIETKTEASLKEGAVVMSLIINSYFHTGS
ncbi:uncharacterized protein LOC119354098 [Triticum dicoccoides]|uniref:uncharacterized protein LOC119354098 n=1 Tax=Triticum dicoccoides TaxID=85692 RepID=UPI001890858D|nr:uncharacterized protein LOC119354098 [Triticum dicoccoides]XP_037476696.1 uncharacterized protein LOC119354098 [Triticum dicoccoides]XP_037476698.1 uncharacterized protein LOC119354098 [Triticum dicoccoides]